MNRKEREELARSIINLFEDLLEEHGIIVPDADRTGAEGEAPIYGMTYWDLVDGVCGILKNGGC